MDESCFESGRSFAAATVKERVGSLREDQSAEHSDEADAELAARRMQQCRAQAPFATGSHFADRQATDGLSEDQFRYCLSEPVEVLSHRLADPQDWLQQIMRAFSRSPSSVLLPLSEAVQSQKTAGFLTLIEPLLHDALDRVQEGAETLARSSSNPPFDPTTVASLLFANLPQQLLFMLSRTLVLEFHVARLEGRLNAGTSDDGFRNFVEGLHQRDAAVALLQEYPVLARQLVVRIENWIQRSLEFLHYLTTDWELIRSTFAPGGDPGVLVNVRGDAGDSHRGGRSVQIARFTFGLQLVYKPRSLRVDLHFQDLLTWLNAKGAHPSFRTLRVLDRGDHGWAEFVSAQSCISAGEVRRFYERQGSYLALLYALEATDFHYENLIAIGEYPLLVDLETLFHPRVKEQDLWQAAQFAGDTMNHSVLRVGLLPQHMWSDGESAGIDLSGLGSKFGQLTPHTVPRWEGAGTDQMHLLRTRVEIPAGLNRPMLDGMDVNILDYADAVVAGFTSLYQILLKHRDELLSNHGPIAACAEDEVRVIMRPTQNYAMLMGESFHPDVLRDALDRERLFDNLWAAVEYYPYLAKLIPSEHQDLQNGDIPIFNSRPNSRDLWTSARERIANFFDEPGLVRVRRRIRELSDQDCTRQLWFVRASLATLAKAGDTTRYPTYRPNKERAPADRERLLFAARRAGDRLEEMAFRSEQDSSWIGLTLANQQDWFLAPLGLDLYDGLPGVALFLGYLGEITDDNRYTNLAKGALNAVWEAMRGQSSVASIGGFDGGGGIAYALMHLGRLWNQPDLLAKAEAIVERILPLIEKDERFDVISGSAGCLVSMLALYRCVPSSRTLAAAVRCGDHLLAHTQPMQPGLGWLLKGIASKPPAGFSHGVAGISWALLELAGVTGEERFRATGLAAIEYERSLFSPAEGNWPDLRELAASDTAAADNRSARFSMLAWCHGAPGIGLARLLCLRHLDDFQIRSEINVALKATLARGFGRNHSLCHGDLGNLELLLQASLTLSEPRWRAEVNRIAAIILESIDQNGWLCGNPLGVESPGLMTGLAGIGYELLRLAEPAAVPSVLALAAPNVQAAEARPTAMSSRRHAHGSRKRCLGALANR